MPEQRLISYAQNGEDVVLWRALGHLESGVYVDVGGWDPDEDSVTRVFYERGWHGIDIEPVPQMAERFRRRRPNDEVVQAAITDEAVGEVVLHRFGTSGLSTTNPEFARRHEEHGLDHEDITVPARRLDEVLAGSRVVEDAIHFLKIDVEGAEKAVLGSIDLTRWRPWVLVVEATEPNSTTQTHGDWEAGVLSAGYTFTLFDGLSRFYVAPDHPELVEKLSFPACALDDYVRAEHLELLADAAEHESVLRQAREEALRWRSQAVTYWANAMAKAQASADDASEARHDAARLRTQLAQVRRTLQEARADRKRLRAKVKRMEARIEGAEPPSAAARASVRGRMRAAVQKARGA